MTTDFKIGDPWPFASSRQITGDLCNHEHWFALITPPQKEPAAADRLKGAFCEVNYPTIEKVRHIAGKKRVYEVPVVPRIIYAKFRYAPQWDVMKERRVVQGVFCRNGIPIELTDDDISQVMGLPTEAERIEAERMDAMRCRVGGRAQITNGLLRDFFVDVDRVECGRVWYTTLTGVRGSVSEQHIVRVAY